MRKRPVFEWVARIGYATPCVHMAWRHRRGLLAFGIYELAEGAFGRITAPSPHQTAVKGGLAG
jgi:hypothetical protein